MPASTATFVASSLLLLVCILNVSSVWGIANNNRGHKKLIRPLRNNPRQGESTVHAPLKDVLRQLQAVPGLDTRGNREKRAPGDGPSYSTTELENNTHSFALAIYSGRVNSEVKYSIFFVSIMYFIIIIVSIIYYSGNISFDV